MTKTVHNFPVLFLLLILAQMVISNYFNFSLFVTLSILPAIVMCIPVSVSTLASMVIAFATGLSVDVMADGVIGLNALALVPVALLRRTFIRIFLGEDIINRNEDFTFRKNFLKENLSEPYLDRLLILPLIYGKTQKLLENIILYCSTQKSRISFIFPKVLPTVFT